MEEEKAVRVRCCRRFVWVGGWVGGWVGRTGHRCRRPRSHTPQQNGPTRRRPGRRRGGGGGRGGDENTYYREKGEGRRQHSTTHPPTHPPTYLPCEPAAALLLPPFSSFRPLEEWVGRKLLPDYVEQPHCFYSPAGRLDCVPRYRSSGEVGGWVGGWVEEVKALRTRCWTL